MTDNTSERAGLAIDDCHSAFITKFCPYRGSPDPYVVWRAAWQAALATKAAEPVAWRYRFVGRGRWENWNVALSPLGQSMTDGWEQEPLYTATPPAPLRELSDARLRGIASNYFPDRNDWPAAVLCLRHLLMEQARSAEFATTQPAQAEKKEM